MASVPVTRYTPEQYLAIEREAEFKSELVMGEMIAMAGGSEDHNTIAGNVYGYLFIKLQGTTCRPFNSDMKVNVGTSFFYPDVSVYCGQRQRLDNRRDVLLNPLIVVEVLSKSTEGYDLNFKLSEYSKIESLRELIYISQKMPLIHHLSRSDAGNWTHTTVTNEESGIHFTSIDGTLSFAEIYQDVEFADAPKALD
jgi:Uma2 family endonuclease